MNGTVKVTASSRLHFGLLSLQAASDSCGLGRQFGGVGLMVQEPRVQVEVNLSRAWSGSGPQAARALAFAQRLTQSPDFPPVTMAILVKQCPPEHVGLGTGTQLGLAVARAAAVAAGRNDLDAVALAQRLGRGARSALGIHGFAQGGFLVDGGKGPGTAIAPLVTRLEFPQDWRVLLVIPRDAQGVHGLDERRAFAQLTNRSDLDRHSERLCRLVLLGLLPALMEKDLPGFGEALYQFNREVGEMFRPLQGGIYSHSRTAAIIEFLRAQGIAGVGQSSWGPTVFAVTQPDRTEALVQSLEERFGLSEGEVLTTVAANQGAYL